MYTADVFCIPDIYVIIVLIFYFFFGTSFDGLTSFWFPVTLQINIVVVVVPSIQFQRSMP